MVPRIKPFFKTLQVLTYQGIKRLRADLHRDFPALTGRDFVFTVSQVEIKSKKVGMEQARQ